jgi:hypothetical protein
MKKLFTLFAAVLIAAMVLAQEKAKFTYEAGAEVVSSYIWRGLYNGGLSFQPSASVGFVSASDKVKFDINVWGNIGASDWKFRFGQPNPDENDMNPNTHFVPEVDFTATLQVYGLVLGATHYYYFGGQPFFSGLGEGGSQTEVQVGLRFGDFSKASGLYFNWHTMVAGDDAFYQYDENDQVIEGSGKRAWSTYIEFGYDAEFEHDITLGVCVGFTPWKSLYTDYEGTFAVNNISLRLGKTWNVADIVDIELFGLGSLNIYAINHGSPFAWEAGDYKIGAAQRLNGTIGLGFWF